MAEQLKTIVEQLQERRERGGEVHLHFHLPAGVSPEEALAMDALGRRSIGSSMPTAPTHAETQELLRNGIRLFQAIEAAHLKALTRAPKRRR